jgi:secondary thiamine-phosphate synthase enzyme
MTIRTFTRRTHTRGEGEIKDLTGEVASCVAESGVREGTVTVFVPGSTAGVTTIEYEPGVVQDLADCFDRLAPRDLDYAHERAWHDGNGHSHVRAAVLGPSLVVPIIDGRPHLGTWQQLVLVDFDNRSRDRSWSVTVMGD